MTPKLCSVHNHATLCDGRDTPEAMAAAAFAQGIRYFGLSCHSHTPIPDDEGAVLPADMAAYRDTVLRLRKTYAGRMRFFWAWNGTASLTSLPQALTTGSAAFTTSPTAGAATTPPTGARSTSPPAGMNSSAGTLWPSPKGISGR